MEEGFKIARCRKDAFLPIRGSKEAAGYDLSACDDFYIPSGGKSLVSTGISVAIPYGYYGRIAPRSSLAWKHHIDVGAGVVDSDYRGEVKVVLFNHGEKEFKITRGDRIAQLIITKISLPPICEVTVEELNDTERGKGGFGSTGRGQSPTKKSKSIDNIQYRHGC
jgi:dUTP pyrophosphatase